MFQRNPPIWLSLIAVARNLWGNLSNLCYPLQRCASRCPACRGDSKLQRGALHFHHPSPSAGGSSERRPCWRYHSHLTKQRHDNVQGLRRKLKDSKLVQKSSKIQVCGTGPTTQKDFQILYTKPLTLPGSWHCELPSSDFSFLGSRRESSLIIVFSSVKVLTHHMRKPIQSLKWRGRQTEKRKNKLKVSDA